MANAITDEPARQFRELGYYGPFTVMAPDEMRTYRERIEAFVARHPDVVGKFYHGAHMLLPWLYDLLHRDSLGAGLEAALGPDLVCLGTSFRIKAPGDGKYVKWHQDGFYMRYEPWCATCTLSFTDNTEENGCLRIVPGAHKHGILPHAEEDDPDNLLTRSQHITVDFDASNVRPLETRAGQAVVFDHGMIHGSEPNRSPDRRINMLMDIAPTNAVRPGPRESATFIRGADAYGYFDPEPRPADEFGPLAKKRHRDVQELRNARYYEGSQHVPPALV